MLHNTSDMPRHPSLVDGDTAATRRGHAGRRDVAYPTMPPSNTTTAAGEKPTAHEIAQFKKNQRAIPEIRTSREFQCETCGARCTRSPAGDVSYGHRYGCPERPDELPSAAGARGGSKFDGGDS